MATPLSTIKNWFRTGLKPTQAQFWAVWDSYRHKDEPIPTTDVQNLDTYLNQKVDKVEGWGLTENNYTTEEKQKLEGLNPQVQSDWEQDDDQAADFIRNKPEINGEVEETDPTVPMWVKGITEEDIDTWNAALQEGELPGYNIINDSSSGVELFIGTSGSNYGGIKIGRHLGHSITGAFFKIETVRTHILSSNDFNVNSGTVFVNSNETRILGDVISLGSDNRRIGLESTNSFNIVELDYSQVMAAILLYIPNSSGTLATQEWVNAQGFGSGEGSGNETDPTVPSYVKAITETQISNWESAFGWGNHASEGYLKASTVRATMHDRCLNVSVGVAHEVDWLWTETIILTLSQNFTITEDWNLPTNTSKVLTIYATGDYGLTLPVTWTNNLTGSYDGTVLNLITVERLYDGTVWTTITQAG
ncbi:hypothetical protein [Formosa sp. A9]|uniref:hypothetical protein n=1 Tax=Formosa sp. A9 TaxID=3442641 RepID=UPI003EBD6412